MTDIIQTKYCKTHACFKAFKNGSCITCQEIAQLIGDPYISGVPEIVAIKKGRGRPKGSKNKVDKP